MDFLAQPVALVLFVLGISLISILLSPRTVSLDSFMRGTSNSGHPPTTLMLTLSQTTTWIFARSLMNAAILGYFYGLAGALAYTCYYLSFLTGLYVVEQLRQQGARSVQQWLTDHFGRVGCHAYNVVIGLRLLSEVFANLIVVGLIFSYAFPAHTWSYHASILSIALLALIYSSAGGLRASLRTDVMQMVIFLLVFITALAVMLLSEQFSFADILVAQGVHEQGSRPGWILVMVALLQVFSYPVHDPIMMDRGFIADRATTRKSFIYAFVLSSVCILGFAMFGIQAAIIGASYEHQLLATWQGMFGAGVQLHKGLWAGAIDNLGGTVLASLTKSVKPWGNIVSVGMAASVDIKTSTLPFILRGISLLGVSSANCPQSLRKKIWQQLGAQWRPQKLAQVCAGEVGLDDLPEVFEKLLTADVRGRYLVKLLAED
jgi:Na+/proline symporter